MWKFVDKGHIELMWKVYHTDVALVACKNVIQNKLLSLGVMFTSGDQIPTKQFYSHTQRNFVPFCKNFIDCINVQGFCMYTVDNEKNIPTVIPYTVGKIGVKINKNYNLEYALFIDSDDPEKNVFFAREYDVTPEALLTSPISSYYRSRSFCDMIERNAAFVESFRCKPPIYTETTSKSNFTDEDLLDVGTADDDVRGSLHANRIQKGDMMAHMHEYQTRLSKMLNSRHVDSGSDWFQKKLDPISGLPAFDANMVDSQKEVQAIIPLPIDTRVANVPMPQSRTDLVAIRQDTIRHACLCMGVPEAFLQHNSGTHTANVHTALTMLDASLNRMKSILSYVLEDIYILIYNNSSAPDDSLSIIFPGIEKPDLYRDLFTQGVLTYDGYTRFLMRYYQFSGEDLGRSRVLGNSARTVENDIPTTPGHRHPQSGDYQEHMHRPNHGQGGSGENDQLGIGIDSVIPNSQM